MQTDPDVPTSLGLDAWLARLAEPSGAPGGGSAAGVLMAIAAALLHMVCGYTREDPRAIEAAARVGRLREDALAAARADGIRSAELGAALHPGGADRDARVRDAALAAAASSAELAQLGIALVHDLGVIGEVGNRSYAADTAVAGESLRAGIGAALVNLRANLRLAAAHADRIDASPLEATADAAERARADVDGVLATLSAA
jgi:formiminotetrahydrofolate cyclodeaminase